MKLTNPEAREQMLTRLHRIEGQVRGVGQMLESERDCYEIMQQLSAIHSAVQATSRIFLQEYATSCLAEIDVNPASRNDRDSQMQRQKIVQDMITLLDKAP